MKPATKPKMTFAELLPKIQAFNLDIEKYPLYLVAVRGYYLNSMGKAGANDRGLYDDSIFVCSPTSFMAFNANTDPSITRKGIAVLQTGIYYAHKFDTHRGKKLRYPAICQRLDKVTVMRDGQGLDTGMFGINIHKGGYTTTSSEGCLTIYPDQWFDFYEMAKGIAKKFYGDKWDSRIIPLILIENF